MGKMRNEEYFGQEQIESEGLSMKMEIFYDSHELILNSEKISWVRMQNLIKSDDPSSLKVLTQIEIYCR